MRSTFTSSPPKPVADLSVQADAPNAATPALRLVNAANEADGVAPLLVSAAQLAGLLAISLRLVRRFESEGRLPEPIRLGHCLRYRFSEVRDWIASGAPDRATWQRMKQARACDGGR